MVRVFRKFTWPALGAITLALTGCAQPTLLDAVLSAQDSGVLGQTPAKTLVLEVINQTSDDIQVDFLIDDQPLTITCSATKQVCPQELTTCPSKVEAVQQRSLDSFGRFIGGRNFNGSADFTFTTGEFNCGSFLIYKFTEDSATAFPL